MLDGADLSLDADGAPTNPCLVVAARDVAHLDPAQLARALRATLRVVVFVLDGTDTSTEVVDSADVVLGGVGSPAPGVVATEDPVEMADVLAARIQASARASIALAWLLRSSENLPVLDALTVESSTYSMLQSGPDFASWLAARGTPRAPGPPERVRVSADGDDVRITLARPGRRNAVDAAMRDALCDALMLAILDPTINVTIDAEGPSFSAGGDLDEFGSAPDPVTAHIVRVAAGVARLLHQLSARVTVRLHGDCVGAGIEMPAFAGRVVAAPSARFRLPEVAMGLVPGAGGTVSLPRRIGRSRTAWLALSGETIDARTALSWGLVDAIEPDGPDDR